MAWCLVAFCGCSTAHDVVVQQEFVPVTIPEALLAPIPPVYKPVTTTGGIVDQLTATRGSRAVCVAQLDGIRKYQADTQSLFPPPAVPGPKKATTK
ncbi:Rz1-like lysis system protein LysC [Mesorhizobium huakuii]|uniref:Rz1-like lysis system protein LysC n=1 Tax=Mesorhizobium huakuii TaxID=28104 RepID=UPI003D798731